MAKGLDGLIRFRRHQLDEVRRGLGDLLREEADLEQRTVSLEKEIQNEQKIASDKPAEAGFLYGHYAVRAIQRRAQLANALSQLRKKIEEARENVRAGFRALKVFEIAEENRLTEEEREFRHGEQLQLDEIGLELYRRRT